MNHIGAWWSIAGINEQCEKLFLPNSMQRDMRGFPYHLGAAQYLCMPNAFFGWRLMDLDLEFEELG